MGLECLEDVLKYEMIQARTLCYQYTGNQILSQIKYAMTFIFHYLPEKLYLIFFYPLVVVLISWLEDVRYFFWAVDILDRFYQGLKWPSKLWTSYFCRKKGTYEEIVYKMWRNPIVPYHVIIDYMKFHGRTCPNPE
jgi:hypothetical protein